MFSGGQYYFHFSLNTIDLWPALPALDKLSLFQLHMTSNRWHMSPGCGIDPCFQISCWIACRCAWGLVAEEGDEKSFAKIPQEVFHKTFWA